MRDAFELELVTAKLAEQRDQFLKLSARNRVSHGIRESGEHGVALLYCPNDGIEALSFRAEGDSYWSALRAALAKLPEVVTVQDDGAAPGQRPSLEKCCDLLLRHDSLCGVFAALPCNCEHPLRHEVQP